MKRGWDWIGGVMLNQANWVVTLPFTNKVFKSFSIWLRYSLMLSYVYYVLDSILDPDLNRNTIKHRDNHKHRYAAEIILYFINAEYWNMLTNSNENNPTRAMVAYLWEEMWWLHASELSYNEARRPIYCWEIVGKPLKFQNLTLEDETPNYGPRLG